MSWLESTGFPLEMATANALRSEGFEVRQSTPYLDPETEKGREIDVTAIDPDWMGAIDITFALECKSSSKPWIVLTSDHAFAGYNRLFAFSVMSDSAGEVVAERMPNLTFMPFIQREDEGGYGLRQGLADGSDAAYVASMSALKACCDIIRRAESKSYKPLAFAFPVIVVDTPLFECRLNGAGELELKEVGQSEFLFSAHIPKYRGCSIRVVTKSQLGTFAATARNLAKMIRTDLKDQEKRVLSFLG